MSAHPPSEHPAARTTAGANDRAPNRIALLLLDIDGTLLYARGTGRIAFSRALRATFGWEDDIAYINFSGATDLDVLRQICERHGATPKGPEIERFFGHLALELDAGLTATPPKVFPGVRELLRALSADGDTLIGLVTGNTGECAQIKLRHAGLHGHFVLGAFGHEHADRVEIARLALRRADARAAGRPLDPVVLIGDTPADIAAARAIGARAMAVATGQHDAASLRAAEADLVVESLDDPAVWRLLKA